MTNEFLDLGGAADDIRVPRPGRLAKALGMNVVDTRIEGRDLSALRHRSVRRLSEYWLAQRRGRTMPSREDIDLGEIPWAAPHAYLVDYERPAGRFRYRIAGAEIERQYASLSESGSLEGLYLEDLLPPSEVSLIVERWRPLADRGAIVHMQGLIYASTDSFVSGERLLLPLSDIGGPVSGLLGLTVATGKPVKVAQADRRIVVTYVEARVLAEAALETQPNA